MHANTGTGRASRHGRATSESSGICSGIAAQISSRLAPIKVPIIDWIDEYNTLWFVKDVIAGLTVFILMIPTGMAYAVVGGLPPVYGLYSASFPQFIYAILGTSRQLTLGPMAVTALLLGRAVQNIGVGEGSQEYVLIALNITMLVGLITFLIGTLKLGVLVNFLSNSVLSGFLTASASLISLSQMKYILGIAVPKLSYSHEVIWYLLTHLNETNGYAVAIGLSSWVVLYVIKELRKRFKLTAELNSTYKAIYIASNSLTLVSIVIGTAVSYSLIQSGVHLQVVGFVPPGLKFPEFFFVDFGTLIRLVPDSFIISIVAFTGNWAVTKKYSVINCYDVSPTQELIATGLTNILGVYANAFVINGALARSAVNAECGAQTQIAGCISSICMIISLLFFTRFLYYIPMAILGGLINVSMASMINFQDMWNAYNVDKHDCAVMVVPFLCTFFVGISEGIFLGVVLSIGFVMETTAYPKIATLGRMPDHEGSSYYQDVRRFHDATQIPRIAIVRMDASLYFANAEHFKEVVTLASKGALHSSPEPIQLVILDVSAWVSIDLTGLNILNDIHAELISSHIQLAFSSVKGSLRDYLKRTKFIAKLGEQFMHETNEDAVQSLEQRRSNLRLEQRTTSEKLRGDVIETRLAKVLAQEEYIVSEVEKNPMIGHLGGDEVDSNDASTFEHNAFNNQ